MEQVCDKSEESGDRRSDTSGARGIWWTFETPYKISVQAGPSDGHV